MQDRIWLDAYEAGVPDCIGDICHQSVADYMQYCCRRYADLPAIRNFGVSLSYAELQKKGALVAGFFQQNLELTKGDRLALVLPNLLQSPVIILGALQAGLIVVNFNPGYSQRELISQLHDCGATTMVIFAGCTHLLEGVLDQTSLQHVIVTNVGDLFPRPKALLMNSFVKYTRNKMPGWKLPDAIPFVKVLQSTAKFVPLPIGHEDTAFLQYTGGTTGVAKGAILSHGNILANIEQTILWTRRHLRERRETVIVALPLYHIFGLTINFLSNLQFGGVHELITDPRDTRVLIKIMKKSGFTIFAGVNVLFSNLIVARAFRKLDFSDLRLVIGGGAAVQSSVAEQWQELTGIPISQAYGLTETSPGVCCCPLYLTGYTGAVGLPVSSTLVKICDEEGRVVDCTMRGELFVKGPQVMQGYWQKPVETGQVLSADGWLKTGDIAVMDDQGYVRIVDRKKDLIIVSGFNVYPIEIEDVLINHPGISDVGVIGKSDEKYGEIVAAFVVRKTESLSKTEIENYCRKNLAAYKIPRKIVFVQEIPKSDIGKVLRKGLRNL